MATRASLISRALLVCALGYLIDVADVHLFAVLRVASLADLGVPAAMTSRVAGWILNAQMAGMLAGAFLWGYLGDRLGRLKALYGSIVVYSLGALGCAFARGPLAYGVLRAVTGFGVAGETGAAVTLVAELMPALERGWGVALISGVAFLGPVLVIFASALMPWRHVYAVAGACGLGLLLLRLELVEPEVFRKAQGHENRPGSWRLLLQPAQARAAVQCLALGLPLIYAWSLLNFFSLELGGAVTHGAPFRQKVCLMVFYVGASAGDVLSALASQLWGSRRKSLAVFLGAGAALSAAFLLLGPRLWLTARQLYAVYFALGVCGGCWALFTIIAAEHFGTNIRATTSIVIANLARGFTVPMVFAFQALGGAMSVTHAAALIGGALYLVGFAALTGLRETHGADLDYVETLERRSAGPLEPAG